MKQSVRITVLAENSTLNETLRSEHGLSLWVETEAFKFVFDTGQSSAYLDNARRLGVPVEEADAIVLSHGHYDHSGGLSFWRWPLRRLYLHPACVRPRYSCDQWVRVREIGMPQTAISVVHSAGSGVCWTDGPTAISHNIGVTGFIPRRSQREECGGRFFLDAQCSVSDPIADDQAVWITTRAGVVVLLGCAHAGPTNTLEFVGEHLGTKRFHAVVGGLHLEEADAEHVLWTAQRINHYGVQRLIVGHCTGHKTIHLLSSWCNCSVERLWTGAAFEL